MAQASLHEAVRSLFAVPITLPSTSSVAQADAAPGGDAWRGTRDSKATLAAFAVTRCDTAAVDTSLSPGWRALAQAHRLLASVADDLRGSSNVYYHALGNGVHEQVTVFLRAVDAVEEDVRAQALDCSRHVPARLRVFASLLPDLHAFLTSTFTLAEGKLQPKLAPGQLLDELLNREQVCAAAHKDAFTRLRYHVHQPFLSLITRWIAFGELDTTLGSVFFIRQRANVSASVAALHTAGSTEADGDTVVLDKQLKYLHAEREWARGFVIHVDCVPVAYVPVTVAQDVLLVGRAVRVLRAATDAEHDAARHRAADPPAVPGSDRGWRFTSTDEVDLCTIMAAFRHAPAFSAISFATTMEHLRKHVLHRLWQLLVQQGAYLRHATALRAYLLLGRGDFFQAFLEHAKLLGVPLGGAPSPAPLVAAHLMSGPWTAAATTVGIRGEAHALSWLAGNLALDDDADAAVRARLWGADDASDGAASVSVSGNALASTSPEDDCFDNVQLVLRHRLLQWTLPGWRGAGGENTRSRGRPHAGAHDSIFRHWKQGDAGADTSGMSSRPAAGRRPAFVDAVRVGAATTQQVTTLAAGAGVDDISASVASDGMGDDAAVATRLLLAPLASHDAHTGALWLPQPILVERGFCIRAVLSVHVNAFQHVGGDAATGAHDTATAALVIQRDGPLVCGAAPADVEGQRPAAIPGAGFDDIENSLVLQLLFKRLPASAVAHDEAAADTGDNSRPGGPSFRIVAAVYGPPERVSRSVDDGSAADGSVSRDGRSLLASGVIMDMPGTVDCTYIDTAADCTVTAYAFYVMVQYTPAAGSEPAALRVSLLDVPALVPAHHGGSNDARVGPSTLHFTSDASSRRESMDTTTAASIATAAGRSVITVKPSAVQAATRLLLHSPLSLDEVVDFAFLRPAGRGRAFVGFTAEKHHAPNRGAIIMPQHCPHMSVEHMDVYAVSDVDADGVGSIALAYDVPWPLQLLFTPTSMAALQDVFHLLLHVKAASLRLKDTWSILMDAFSATSSTGVSGSGSSSSNVMDGISARVSGAGGKRAADPRVHQRTHMRLAVHRLLQPVWLLRSQLSAAVDGLVYHFQVDVIEGAFMRLGEQCAASETFDALQRAHEAFVLAILNGCFLTHPSALACVERILRGADRFASLVQASATNLSALLQPDQHRTALMEVSAAFSRDLRLLMQLLTAESGDAGASLAARFSFNEFFVHSPVDAAGMAVM